jgi:peptide/nickel transport system permease protein
LNQDLSHAEPEAVGAETAMARWRAGLTGLVSLGARLLGTFLLTLLGSALLIQLLLWASPGDPIDLIPNGEEMRSALETEWGLGDPIWLRFLRFCTRALQGDLGHSLTYRPGAAVTELVLPAAARSMSLLVPALVLTFALGFGLAYLLAGRASLLRHLVRAISVMPVFLLAFVLVLALNGAAWQGMSRGIIERPSWFALPDADSPMKLLLAVLAMAIGSGAVSEVQAACEDEIVRVRNSPFIDAAMARGAPLWRHVLPNLVAPLTAVVAGRAAFFVGGVIIAEKVLQLNGAGSMLWQACRMRDYPVAMGIALLASAVVCGARLAGDLLRVWVDPRLREPGH